MSKSDLSRSPGAAPEAVSIFFHDRVINYLFSELLESRGVKTRIVEDAKEIRLADKIITEPQYLNDLSEDAKARCLVVGDYQSIKNLNVLSLSQPLSINKVERAIRALLETE